MHFIIFMQFVFIKWKIFDYNSENNTVKKGIKLVKAKEATASVFVDSTGDSVIQCLMSY